MQDLMTTLFPIRVAALAVTATFLGGCGGEATTTDAREGRPEHAAVAQSASAAAPKPSPDSTPKADPFAAPTTNATEAATLAWLGEHMEDRDNASMYDAAVGHAIERIEACGNAACRRDAIADRRAAAAFATGRPARVAGLPFTHGRFARAEAGYTGPIRIVPLDPGSALLVINLSFKGRPVCTLDAVLTPGAGGSFRVAPLATALPELVLIPRDPDDFALTYADPSHRPSDVDHCTIGTSIDGRYTLSP